MLSVNRFAWSRGLLFVPLIVTLLCAAAGLAAQDETKTRDEWQQPDRVMDALGIKAGSAVGDIGAGGGYFTFHLAKRVGPNGKVYAEDILEEEVKKIRDRAESEKLVQVEGIVGTKDDPKLPAEKLDAVLIVNAYHEMREHDSMLRALFRALKPGGLLAIIDAPAPPGEAREKYYERHRIPEQFVRDDTAHNGFSFVRQEPGFHSPDRGRDYIFLIFKKPETKNTSGTAVLCCVKEVFGKLFEFCIECSPGVRKRHGHDHG